MSILRAIVTAMLLTLVSVGFGHAQSVEEYGALDTSRTAPVSQDEVGLYDSLSADDYERVGQDISMLSATQFSLAQFRSGIIKLLNESPRLLSDLGAAMSEVSPTDSPLYFGGILLWIFGFFVIAYVLERQVYGRRMVGPWFIRLQVENPRGIAEKLPILALRAVLGLVGILISLVIVGFLTVTILDLGDPATQKTVLVVVPAIAIARISAIIWRMVLSPYLSNYRIPTLSDGCARKLFNWLWITVTVSLLLIAFTYWVDDLGAQQTPYALVTFLAAIIIMVINVAMISRQSRCD